MPIASSEFRPAWWLRGAHVQTIYPYLCRRPRDVPWRAERLELPDGDFVDLQWTGPEDGPLIALFHGLEGSGESPYIRGLRAALTEAGMASVLMQFRGCSGEPNRLARGYHSGDTRDIDAFIQVLQRRFEGRWLGAVGFSLGGNALLKYLGESGADCHLSQAVAVSVPFDLARCADRLARGASRVYSHQLLSGLKTKIAARRDLMQASGVDVDATLRCRSFRDFDGAVIAPIFGFADAADYYAQSSCTQFLGRIAVPTLILHAEDDPFMTPEAVPSEADLSASVTLELSEHGGHVGFVSGPSPGLSRYWLDGRITQALRAPAG